jgi:hypothetical protein
MIEPSHDKSIYSILAKYHGSQQLYCILLDEYEDHSVIPALSMDTDRSFTNRRHMPVSGSVVPWHQSQELHQIAQAFTVIDRWSCICAFKLSQ